MFKAADNSEIVSSILLAVGPTNASIFSWTNFVVATLRDTSLGNGFLEYKNPRESRLATVLGVISSETEVNGTEAAAVAAAVALASLASWAAAKAAAAVELASLASWAAARAAG